MSDEVGSSAQAMVARCAAVGPIQARAARNTAASRVARRKTVGRREAKRSTHPRRGSSSPAATRRARRRAATLSMETGDSDSKYSLLRRSVTRSSRSRRDHSRWTGSSGVSDARQAESSVAARPNATARMVTHRRGNDQSGPASVRPAMPDDNGGFDHGASRSPCPDPRRRLPGSGRSTRGRAARAPRPRSHGVSRLADAQRDLPGRGARSRPRPLADVLHGLGHGPGRRRRLGPLEHGGGDVAGPAGLDLSRRLRARAHRPEAARRRPRRAVRTRAIVRRDPRRRDVGAARRRRVARLVHGLGR